MRIIHSTPTDGFSNLRMTLQVSEQANRLFFKQGEWNAITRTALYQGALHWLDTYLPLRFTDYARSNLGYRSRSKKTARRGKSPLVKTGQLQDVALRDSWAEARATAGNAYTIVHIATGMTIPDSKHPAVPYGVNPLVYQTLTTITTGEVEAVALTMEAVIKDFVAGASTTVTRKKTVRKTLTDTQRTTLAPTRRASPHQTSRKAA